MYLLLGLIISILAFLEINFITNFKDELLHEQSASWFFITSICLGFFTILLGLLDKISIQFIKPTKWSYLILFAITALVTIDPFYTVLQKFQFNSIDATKSDIIPQIQTMIHWLKQGVFPYQSITDWGYELFPTYLPMTWTPFIIPDLLHADYRIFAFLIFLIGLFFIYRFNKNSLLGQVVSGTLIYVLFWKISIHEDSILGYTIETMIAGFYFIFVSTWKSKNKYFVALGLLLCVLSRYSLVLWLPIFFVYLWKQNNFKFSLNTGLLTLLGVILLYILPFMTQDVTIYQKGMEHHSKAALNEWKGQPWQKDKTRPYSLYKGVGIAYLFFKKPGLTLEDKLDRLQKFHISILVGTVLIFSLITFFFFSKLKDPILFLLGTFKLYLAIFYHFIQIPYTYLYIVLIIMSIPILLKIWRTGPQEI